MPILAWRCAHGDAPPAQLAVAATVAIAPADDSVDTNAIAISGHGTISSFGPCPHTLRKQVSFYPFGPGTPSIVLVNSASLKLLGASNRTITAQSFGIYACDGANNWTETSFSATGTASSEARIAALESQVADLETRVAIIEDHLFPPC